MEQKPIDNPALTNEQIAAQYEPMRPIAFVRSFSLDGTPCAVVTCFNAYAILYAVEHSVSGDTVRVQPICQHPNRHYSGDRCFECWKADRDGMREHYRITLASIIAAGITVLETWPSGNCIDWAMDLASRDAIAFHHKSCDRHVAFRAIGAEAIAEHLEGRRNGFRTTLEAYCHRCGDTTVPIVIDAPGDPICPQCQQRDAQQRDEFRAEDHC